MRHQLPLIPRNRQACDKFTSEAELGAKSPFLMQHNIMALESSPAELLQQIEQGLTAAKANVDPTRMLQRLIALEIHRLRAISQLSDVYPNSTPLEQAFISTISQCLNHTEARRRYFAIDVLWRCLIVDGHIERQDLGSAQIAVLEFFDPTKISVANGFPLGSAQELKSLGLVHRKYLRTLAAHDTQMPGKADLVNGQDLQRMNLLSELSLNWAKTVAQLSTHVEIYMQQARLSASQDSLPSPKLTSPLAQIPATQQSSSPSMERRANLPAEVAVPASSFPHEIDFGDGEAEIENSAETSQNLFRQFTNEEISPEPQQQKEELGAVFADTQPRQFIAPSNISAKLSKTAREQQIRLKNENLAEIAVRQKMNLKSNRSQHFVPEVTSSQIGMETQAHVTADVNMTSLEETASKESDSLEYISKESQEKLLKLKQAQDAAAANSTQLHDNSTEFSQPLSQEETPSSPVREVRSLPMISPTKSLTELDSEAEWETQLEPGDGHVIQGILRTTREDSAHLRKMSF